MDAINAFQRQYDPLREEERALEVSLKLVDSEIARLRMMLEDRESRRLGIVREKNAVKARISALIEGSQSRAMMTPASESTLEDSLERELAAAVRSSTTHAKTPVSAADSRPAHSAGARRQQDLHMRGSDLTPSHWHKKFPFVNRNWPTVVRIDGKLFAVTCFVGDCRANAHSTGSAHGFFKGLRGLQMHIQRSHPEEKDIELQEVADKCLKVPVNARDAGLLGRGQDPHQKIELIFAPELHDEEGTSSGQTTRFPEQLNATYPHVVRLEGKWHELFCKICGANAREIHKSFFNGARGLVMHVAKAHPVSGGVSHANALQYCTPRPVSDKDIALMSGKPLHKPEDVDIRLQYSSPSEDPNKASPAHVDLTNDIPAANDSEATAEKADTSLSHVFEQRRQNGKAQKRDRSVELGSNDIVEELDSDLHPLARFRSGTIV